MDIIIDKKRWREAQDFLRNTKGKRTHVIHDYDVDGISGGLLLRHTLERLGAKATASTRVGRGMGMAHEELVRIKERFDPEVLCITDQDPKSYGHYERLREVFPDVPLIIIDHHFVQEYDDAVFVHPKVVYGVDGSKIPSAKLIYDLCQSVEEAADLGWLACLGILGDNASVRFRSFLEEEAERNDITLPEDPYTSDFGKIAEAIECCSAAGEQELLSYVESLKEQESFVNALELGNPCSQVIDEVNDYVRRGLGLAEKMGAVHWLPIESKYSINGWVTTLISVKYPDRVFAGYREQVDGYSVNTRFQHATVHLGNILRELTPRFGGTGGGHAPAAGAFIPEKSWEEFRKAFSERVTDGLAKAS